MGKIVVYEGQHVMPDLRTVMALMQCTRDNPTYDELCDIYEAQVPKLLERIHPKGAFCEGVLHVDGANEDLIIGREVIYSMGTLGTEIVTYISQTMEEDLLEGMMVDFMADSALFSFGNELAEEIRKYCITRGIGIHQGYEAPNLIPMSAQRDTWKELHAETHLGITMTDGDMLRPIKSSGHIYTISDDPTEFHVTHDCKSCPMKNCAMRGLMHRKGNE